MSSGSSSPSPDSTACKVLGGGRATRDSVAPLLLEFMSFGEQGHLLRAMPLSAMLRCGAQVLASSSRQPDSYNLSKLVCAIDAFVSHNWQGNRWAKLAVLCWHYNLGLALVVTALSQIVVLGLAIGGLFPTFDSKGLLYRDRLYPRTCVSEVTAVPVFLLTLLLGGCLRRTLTLGRYDPMVFLDKTCIDQQNKEVQRQGVQRLGAFLAHSRHMLVLYSNVYLTRLWTVYEIACFLALHPASHLSLVPTILPTATLVGLLLTFFVRTIASAVDMAVGFGVQTRVFFFCLGPLLVAVFRFLARQREAMRKQLSSFAVRSCVCTCEEDRTVVYSNISELMRTTGVVGCDSSQEVALDAFDFIVQSELPQVLETALNFSGKKYLLFVLWSLSTFAPVWVGKMAGLSAGLPFSTALAETSLTMVLIFACSPLTCLMFERLARVRLDWHGPCEWMFLLVAGWFGVAFFAVFYDLLVQCWSTSDYPRTGQLDRGAGVTVAAMASVCLLCAWMFGVRDTVFRRLQRRRTSWTNQDPPQPVIEEVAIDEEAPVSKWRVSL